MSNEVFVFLLMQNNNRLVPGLNIFFFCERFRGMATWPGGGHWEGVIQTGWNDQYLITVGIHKYVGASAQ